jgi:hypothetical protein
MGWETFYFEMQLQIGSIFPYGPQSIRLTLVSWKMSVVGLPSAPRNVGLKPTARFAVWVEFTIAESWTSLQKTGEH